MSANGQLLRPVKTSTQSSRTQGLRTQCPLIVGNRDGSWSIPLYQSFFVTSLPGNNVHPTLSVWSGRLRSNGRTGTNPPLRGGLDPAQQLPFPALGDESAALPPFWGRSGLARDVHLGFYPRLEYHYSSDSREYERIFELGRYVSSRPAFIVISRYIH